MHHIFFLKKCFSVKQKKQQTKQWPNIICTFIIVVIYKNTYFFLKKEFAQFAQKKSDGHVFNKRNRFFNVNSFSSEWLAYFETGARLLWATEWSVHLQLRLTAGTGKGSQVERRKQSCCFSRRADTDNDFISLCKRRWSCTIATSHLVPPLPLAGTSQRRRQHWRPACSNEHVQTKEKRERELQKREWE